MKFIYTKHLKKYFLFLKYTYIHDILAASRRDQRRKLFCFILDKFI